MLRMHSQIMLYEEIGNLSARMAEAARASDWDTLSRLQRMVAGLRDNLAKAGSDVDCGLTSEEIERKAVLIQRILDNDAEVRRYTEPRMECVRQFLGSAARKRKSNRVSGVVI